MALVEVEDSLLSQLSVPYTNKSGDLKSLSDFQKAYAAILDGPNRMELLKVLKKQYPNLAIPEIDAATPVNEAVAAVEKKFNDYVESVEKEKKEAAERARESAAHDTVAKGRTWLRSEGYDDEGVAAVEKIMQDRNLPDYEAGSALFQKANPKPTPLPGGSFGGNSLDWFKPADDAPDHKLLVEDPVKFKNAEVAKFFQQKAEGRLNLAQ